MPNPLTVRRLLALAVCLCAGCAVSPGAKKPSAALADATAANRDGQASGTSTAAPNAAGSRQSTASAGPEANGNPAAGGSRSSSPSAPDPRVLDDVLAEIAELGPIEPEAQKRLIADLRKTDPSYWPMLVQTFRASLEYRRRSAQKAAEARLPHPNPLPQTESASRSQPVPLPEGEAVSGAETASAGRTEIIQVAANEPIASTLQSLATPGPATKAAPQPAAATPPATASVSAAVTPIAPASAPPAVEKAGRTSASPTSTETDWRRHLDAAITELERQTREHPGDVDALAKQVYLRLLDLAGGRRDDALKPIAGVPPAQQDYWAKQIFALSTYLDQGSADPSRRAAEASLHLARALAALGEQAPLVVHNMAFCTDVHSYGVLKRFEPAEFHAGQQVLLYAEVENFKSEETAQGFHTSLEASYQIHDRQGQRVAHDDLSLTEEHCQNRRRDFFVRYFITLPKNIYEGDYTLELTIEDKLGRKINQSSIDFSIKAK